MTLGYDTERLVVALKSVGSAADALYRHDLPDWFTHRLALICSEAESLEIEITKNERAKS